MQLHICNVLMLSNDGSTMLHATVLTLLHRLEGPPSSTSYIVLMSRKVKDSGFWEGDEVDYDTDWCPGWWQIDADGVQGNNDEWGVEG